MIEKKILQILSLMALLGVGFILHADPVIILCPEAPSFHEDLGVREAQRYVYLRTGVILSVRRQLGEIQKETTDVIVIARKDRPFYQDLDNPQLSADIARLESEAYLLKTLSFQGRNVHCLCGGDDTGTLYAVYQFAEALGIRFYLHGDVIPDDKMALKIPELDHMASPLFNIRGIQPFHDFPEGPDWWTADDYKAVFTQLIKMRMNFFGLHTYPQGHAGPEPLVWIGSEEDLNPDGTVQSAYPARHFTSFSGTWGYKPRRTGDYDFGAGDLYDSDDYGTCYMNGMTPWPSTDEDEVRMFNRTGDFFGDVFSFGRMLGLKNCIGTETFLIIPDDVKARLKLRNKSSLDSTVIESLYTGMFEWIKRNMPLDYYWFWTPEDWTWQGTPQKNVDSTMMDLRAAIRAVNKTGYPFTLATCGWVLGPEQNRSLFDEFLPKTMPFSCINRNVGFEPVEPDFARISGRPQWAIPWMEDDPALIIPQLWVGRMRRDAADALAYGCSGLIGIHWRTRILGMNVSALAKAGWEQPWNTLPELATHEEAKARFMNEIRDLACGDFYEDWALSQFGQSVAGPMARLFEKLDGGPLNLIGQPRKTNLPRPSEWYKGPGGLIPDSLSWDERKKDYMFIETMERLRPEVKGAGCLERFDYWLNQFRYLREIGRFNCLMARYYEKENLVKISDDKKHVAEQELLPLRIEMMNTLREIHTRFYRTIKTTGALGNLTNWQQHIHHFYIDEPGVRLAAYLEKPLPPEAVPSKEPAHTKMLIVPTVRTTLTDGEILRLKVLMPGIDPAEASLCYRAVGQKKYKTIPVHHVTRDVYKVQLESDALEGCLEYYIKVADKNGEVFYFPSTAPDLNQTVVMIGSE